MQLYLVYPGLKQRRFTHRRHPRLEITLMPELYAGNGGVSLVRSPDVSRGACASRCEYQTLSRKPQRAQLDFLPQSSEATEASEQVSWKVQIFKT